QACYRLDLKTWFSKGTPLCITPWRGGQLLFVIQNVGKQNGTTEGREKTAQKARFFCPTRRIRASRDRECNQTQRGREVGVDSRCTFVESATELKGRFDSFFWSLQRVGHNFCEPFHAIFLRCLIDNLMADLNAIATHCRFARSVTRIELFDQLE